MAGSKINDYGIGDQNIESLMETTDKQRKSKDNSYSLTNFDNDSIPQIAAGSVVENNGALYSFDSNETIGGTPSDGTVYIMLVPSGDTITAEFTNIAPTFSASKQGWYGAGGNANNRYLSMTLIKSGSDYTEKNYTDQFDLTGEMRMWLTANAPAGFLLCDGAAVSRTTYARLFHLIGTTFGVGDGASTFNLPDMRGRVAMGLTDMGTAEGATSVTTVETPTSVGTTGGDQYLQAHIHTYYQAQALINDGPSRASATNSPNFEFNTTSSGAGNSQNLQPYLALNFIIRF